MKKFELNRKQYQLIRKMDHNQMQEYFRKTYEEGYQAGVKDTETNAIIPDLKGLEDSLKEIKGVGGAKAVVITEAVKSYLERQVSGNNDTSTEISG